MPPLSDIALFAVGACVASFLALIADRLPRGETVVRGGSRCRACGRPLRPFELVPLLSYIVQRGRCRRCRARIPADLPIAELAGGVSTLLAAGSSNGSAAQAATVMLCWALLALALLDWRALWLPDAITLPLAVAGLAAVAALPEPGLADRVAGATLGFAALEALRLAFRRLRGHDGMGAGDPKLLAALGAWLGWSPLPLVVLIAAVIGLMFTALRHRAGSATAREPIPLGTALALAGMLAATHIV